MPAPSPPPSDWPFDLASGRAAAPSPSRCPSEEELLALAAGESQGPRYDHALAHLETCDDCRVLVSELVSDRVGGEATAFPEPESSAASNAPAAATHESGPPPGAMIAGKYRVGRVIGRGGMGVVLEAEHTLLEERVALKFMHPSIAAHPGATGRFLQEARASSKIRSEHVARVLDVGSHEGTPYLVMEYLEGCDLSTLLAREGSLSVPRAVDYVLQACEAIGRAHERGLVHRDLKPANLFLADRDGAPPILKVLDFGIAKAIGADVPTLTASNAFLGSPRYMAPEQVQNAREVDGRADVWALGAILFELLTGRHAFDQGTVASLLVAICAQPAPSVLGLRPDLPPALARVVADCLTIDRALRPQKAADLAARLRGLDAPATVRAAAPPAATPSRPRWFAAGVGAVVLVTGFVVGFGVLGTPRSHAEPAPSAASATSAALLPAPSPNDSLSHPTVPAAPASAAAITTGAAPMLTKPLDSKPLDTKPLDSKPLDSKSLGKPRAEKKSDPYGDRH